jgi:hypothetical protein
MARFVQRRASKGSQKWIQILINEKPELLNSQIRQRFKLPNNEKINWLSPKVEDDYVEYGIWEFLGKVEPTKLQKLPLNEFWPKRGPKWDALGHSSPGENLFFVEAKSHIPELISTLRAKDPHSEAKIKKSLDDTRKKLGSKADFDWAKTFYQYANRLAHVHFLRRNDLPGYLIFVFFLNDSDMKGPKTVDEWQGAIRLLHRCLGLREYLLEKWVVDVFIDVKTFQSD